MFSGRRTISFQIDHQFQYGYGLYWFLKVHFSLWLWLETYRPKNILFLARLIISICYSALSFNLSTLIVLSSALVYNTWQNLMTSMNNPVFILFRGLKLSSFLTLVLKEIMELGWQKESWICQNSEERTLKTSARGDKC